MNQSEKNQQFDQQYSQLLQAAFERELTAEELAILDVFFAQNQEELAEFEAVDQILARLPNVAVPNNFTARVLDEAQRQDQPAPAFGQPFGPSLWQWFFAPQYRSIQLALIATVVLLVGVFGYQSHLSQDREEMAESLQAVATITEMVPGLLTDFDAIGAIDHADPIDEELWAALK